MINLIYLAFITIVFMGTSQDDRWENEFPFLEEESEDRNEEVVFSELAQSQEIDEHAFSILEEEIDSASFSGYATFLPDRFATSGGMSDIGGAIYLFESDLRGRAVPARTLSLEELGRISQRIERNNDLEEGTLTEPVNKINEDGRTLIYVSDEFNFQEVDFFPSPLRAMWESGEYGGIPYDEVLMVESDSKPYSHRVDRDLFVYLNGVEIKCYENVEELETVCRDQEYSISRYVYGINKE